MTLKEIKNKWNKDKDFYRIQELGSGVHSFIRLCLESKELFDLKEGSLSSKLILRKNEYIHENKAKEGRRADFVIYINSDIVIPLEAECYENIKAGINQLFSYQKDYDKQYGILTDGFSWRFYNNNVYREFNLSQIFEETSIFLEFWKEYIKPEFYYLSFFEPQGQLSLLKETDKLPVEENRQIFFRDITKLIKSFQNKLNIEGYFKSLDKKEGIKRAVEITYAYIIQFVLYKTLVDNEFDKFDNEYKEITKAIHECLKIKQYGKILAIIEGISNNISQNIYRPFKKEQEFINQTVFNLIRKPKNELSDVSPWLDIFVFIKKYNFANIQNEIFGYIYENYLKELYEEKKKGQYFTAPIVVNFMLRQIGFVPEEIKKRYETDKNSVSLIDPACGSGTFLYSAVDSIIKAFGNNSQEKSKQIEEIVNKNILGLDIAEFPLYLAEMNILMRMLPIIISEKYNNPIDKKIKVFLTRDSVAEFMDTALRNTMHDIDVKGGQLSWDFKELDLGYKSYVREESDLEEMKKSLEEQPRIPRRRFDYVIGNPPYMHYNECSKQGILIFNLIKQKKAKLNNIYGVNLHSIPGNPKKYRPNPNIYAFFIAVGLSLLKDSGRLCYIIPQTVLMAGDLDVIRYHLAKFTTIEKIITFSGKMFVGRGLKQDKPVATSSLIFVLNREMPSALHKVEIINYKNPDDIIEETLQNILAGKRISRKEVLQANFLSNVTNWNFIKLGKAFLYFYEEYKRNADDISIYYNHALAEYQFKSKFYFDGGYSFKEKYLLDSSKNDKFYYKSPHLIPRYFTIKEFNGFWPNIRDKKSRFSIQLRQANQGYNLLDSKYKIVWSTKNAQKFHFTDDNVIWANIRLSGIGSNNKYEILYLFALLNSKLIFFTLTNLLKLENEKDFLVPITSVKEFVRVPKIIEENSNIKDEIIKRTEEMLSLEDKTLSNLVDFSKVMIQKFDNVLFENNSIILAKEDKKIKLPIKESANLVKKIFEEVYNNKELNFKGQKTSLSELKDLSVIDFETQIIIKDYIDDLVFALYFNIPLKDLGINKAEEIKGRCQKHPHYKLVSEG